MSTAINQSLSPRSRTATTLSRRLPPATVVWASQLVSLLVALICLELSRNQSWLGLRLAASGPEQPPWVRSATGPADGLLSRGDSVVALGLPGEAPLYLRGDDIAREPDTVFADYRGSRRFFERQSRLAGLQAGPELIVHFADGSRVTLEPQPVRPITDLPFVFWLQLACGIGCWTIGTTIWAFRREHGAAGYLATAGLGTLLLTAAAAVYSSRELALPGELFWCLSMANHGGALLTAGAFIAVLCHYPGRIVPARVGPLLLGGFMLLWLADLAQVFPFEHRGRQVTLLLAYATAVALAIRQWFMIRDDPLERAAFQWFLMAWFIGSGLFLAIVTIPALAGVDTGPLQAYGFVLLLLVAIGIALGIARYRLFDMQIWWLRVLALVGGGSGVIALDLALIRWLSLNEPMALAISLAVAGWVYFPLRQWLATHLFRRVGLLRARDVPALLRDVITDTPEAADRLLPEALERLFAPLHLAPLPQAISRTRIADDGLTLHVPGIGGESGWEVRWPDGGGRLFSRQDMQHVEAVHAVLQQVVAYQDAVERSVERERERVAQDLHDEVGARLLTLLHRVDDAHAPNIREAIAGLRQVVHGLGAKPRPLADVLAEWRAELHERCEVAGVLMRWQESATLPDWWLDAPRQTHLAQILREAISNALRHARPGQVQVTLVADEDALLLGVRHDGAVSPPERWRRGRGLRGMQRRARRLDGSLRFQGGNGTVTLEVRIPMAPPVRGVAQRAGRPIIRDVP